MPLTCYFAANPQDWADYRAPLTAAFEAAGLDVALSDRADDPAAVDYIIYAPASGMNDFAPFVNCKAVISLWAGVERIVGNQSLTQPLVRMVEPGMTSAMVEYVTGHVLRHHLGMDAHILGQDGVWRNDVSPPLARDRKVTILGLGALGMSAARALAGLGFAVTGWSRSAKEPVPGVRMLTGEEGLNKALADAEILVLLVPLTAGTENLLNAERLARLPRGAFVINPGRGPLVDDTALLAALDSGQVRHATLDVFRVEPLPKDHPYWAHPHVTVTPHVAAATDLPGAVAQVVATIKRGEAGQPFVNLVDRGRGY